MSTRMVTRVSDEDEDSDEDAEGSDGDEYREVHLNGQVGTFFM